MSVRSSHLPDEHAASCRCFVDSSRSSVPDSTSSSSVPAGAADRREQQEHHADAGRVERDRAIRARSSVRITSTVSMPHAHRSPPPAAPDPAVLPPLRSAAKRGSHASTAARCCGVSGPAFFSNCSQAALHQQIRRGGHRDLLQQPVDHLRRDRIRHVRQQLDRRPTRRRSRGSRMPRRGLPGSRSRPAGRRS